MKTDDFPKQQSDHFQAQIDKVIRYFIIAVAGGVIPAMFVLVNIANRIGWGKSEIFALCCFGMMAILAFTKNFFTPRIRAYLIAIFLFGATMGETYRYGVTTSSFPVLTILPIIGSVIGGLRTGFVTLGVIVVSLIALAWYSISHELMPPVSYPDGFFSPDEWGRHISIFTICSVTAVFLTGSLFNFHQASGVELRGREAQLAKTQSRVIQSAKLAGLGYAVLDPKSGCVLDCNESFAQMHGLTVAAFMSLDFNAGLIGPNIHADDSEKAQDTLRNLGKGDVISGEYRYKLPDGKVRAIKKTFSSKNDLGPDDGEIEVVGQDVTESRNTQEQLFHTQKMDSIGTLTGGVAHDFNNLLAIILGNLELLGDGETQPAQKKLIKSSVDATLRGAELTRNMLSFARKSQLELSVVELNQLVGNMKNWIGRTLPSNIDVETSLLTDLWPIEVDPNSTENGLLNLILNARDAMPEGGKITLETSNVTIDDDYVEIRNEDIEPGRYVLLTVSDTGEGIAPEILKTVFEPFFTTKAVGAGTGMGLSMVDGFMRQSGGTVRVYSEVGVGTTFKLYFPATELSATANQKPSVVTPEVDPENSATILLVEDNIEVLHAFKATLTKAGYHVVDAATGDDAYKIFVENPTVGLLLTDIVMPGTLQGTTLAKALRELRPDLKVIFMSGYAREATIHGNGLRPQEIRLMKPVRREDLMSAVSKALSSPDENSLES